MTKMKSKKMTKSTFAIIIMGIVMVAMLAFGGTFAYFTATSDKVEKSLTTGTVKLVDNAPTVISTDIVVPGDQLISAVTYNPDETTVKAMVIVHYELDAGTSGLSVAEPNAAWTKLEAGYYYQVCEANATGFTENFLGAVTLTGTVDWKEGADKPAAMGATISLVLEARSIQYRNIGDGITETSNAATVAAAAKTILFPAA